MMKFTSKFVLGILTVVFTVALSASGQANAKMRSLSPLHPHFAVVNTVDAAVVFSRIDGDVENGPVASYEAVFDDGRIIALDANYLTIGKYSLPSGQSVAFRAVFNDGSRSNLTAFVDIDAGLADLTDHGQDDLLDYNVGETFEKGGIASGDAVASIPALAPPVIGPFTVLRRGVTSNQTDGPWSYWQHETGYHRAGGGIGGANDTKAFDINLNIGRAVSGATNLDNGMDFFPSATGFVVKYNGVTDAGSGAAKPVLIEHQNGTTKYWTGYLHASVINVRVNDYVTTMTRIGKIGMGGTNNHHLHWVAYQGLNTPTSSGASRLVSFDPQIGESRMNIVPLGTQTIRRGETRQITTTAYGTRPSGVISYFINGSSFSANTWWTSSRTNVATINGSGSVRGVAVGQTTITVYYSGAKATTTVNVTN